MSEGVQSIENYLCKCDAYRAASLPNLLPLPLEMTPASHLEAEICNGALACCKWSDSQGTRYDHYGRPVDIAIITEEYVVLKKQHTGIVCGERRLGVLCSE